MITNAAPRSPLYTLTGVSPARHAATGDDAGALLPTVGRLHNAGNSQITTAQRPKPASRRTSATAQKTAYFPPGGLHHFHPALTSTTPFRNSRGTVNGPEGPPVLARAFSTRGL